MSVEAVELRGVSCAWEPWALGARPGHEQRVVFSRASANVSFVGALIGAVQTVCVPVERRRREGKSKPAKPPESPSGRVLGRVLGHFMGFGPIRKDC